MSREPIDIGAIAELPPYARDLIRRNVDLSEQVFDLQSKLRRAEAALGRHVTPVAPANYTEATIVLRDVEITVHYAPDDDAYNVLAAYIGAQDVLQLVDIDELEAAIYLHEQFKTREARYDRAYDAAMAEADARRGGY